MTSGAVGAHLLGLNSTYVLQAESVLEKGHTWWGHVTVSPLVDLKSECF